MALRKTKNKSSSATSSVVLRRQVHALKEAAYSVNFFACYFMHDHYKNPGAHIERAGL